MIRRLILASMFLGSAAHAQTPFGRQVDIGTWAEIEDKSWTESVRSAIRASSGKASDSQRAVAQRYAECAAATAPDDARTVVLQMTPQAEVRHQHSRLLKSRCNGEKGEDRSSESLEIPTPLLQMWLADALVRREYGAGGPTDLSAVVITIPALPTSSSSADISWTVMRKLGVCISRRDAGSVRLLALTDVATPAEQTAIDALAPAMALCLPAGATVHLRTGDVRGATLLAYYQLAHAAGAAN